MGECLDKSTECNNESIYENGVNQENFYPSRVLVTGSTSRRWRREPKSSISLRTTDPTASSRQNQHQSGAKIRWIHGRILSKSIHPTGGVRAAAKKPSFMG